MAVAVLNRGVDVAPRGVVGGDDPDVSQVSAGLQIVGRASAVCIGFGICFGICFGFGRASVAALPRPGPRLAFGQHLPKDPAALGAGVRSPARAEHERVVVIVIVLVVGVPVRVVVYHEIGPACRQLPAGVNWS